MLLIGLKLKKGENRPHILTSAKHLSWAVHAGWARAHSNSYLPSFYSLALKNAMTAMCFNSWQPLLCFFLSPLSLCSVRVSDYVTFCWYLYSNALILDFKSLSVVKEHYNTPSTFHFFIFIDILRWIWINMPSVGRVLIFLFDIHKICYFFLFTRLQLTWVRKRNCFSVL